MRLTGTDGLTVLISLDDLKLPVRQRRYPFEPGELSWRCACTLRPLRRSTSRWRSGSKPHSANLARKMERADLASSPGHSENRPGDEIFCILVVGHKIYCHLLCRFFKSIGAENSVVTLAILIIVPRTSIGHTPIDNFTSIGQTFHIDFPYLLRSLGGR